MLCGSRVRVEFSHGRGRSKREERGRRRSGSRSPRSRKRFSSNDLCYECGGIYFYRRGGGRSHSDIPCRSHPFLAIRNGREWDFSPCIYFYLISIDRGHYAYDCEIRLRRQRRMG